MTSTAKFVAALTATTLLMTACGNRLEETELMQAQRGEVAGAVANAGSDQTGGVVAGAVPGAVDTPTGTSNAAAGAAPAATTAPGAGSAGMPASGAGTTNPGTTNPGGGKPGQNKGGGTSGATSPAACTGSSSTIHIASIGQQSGVIGAVVQDGPRTVAAWAAMINANGGLNCHPIKYTIADDGGDPAKHQALVQQLVEQQGVSAFVYTVAPITGGASKDYLTKKRIPTIGSTTTESWFYESPMYFPQATSGPDIFEATFASVAGVAAPKKKIATISCIEAALCSGVYALAEQFTERHGLELTYRGQVSITQPDYTASCQNAKTSGAEVFYVGTDTASLQRVGRSCQSIGYKPVFATTHVVGAPYLVKDATMEGLIVSQSVIPWFATQNPEVKRYQDTLARYAPGIAPSAASIMGWVAAQVFAKGLSGAPTTNLTQQQASQALLEGLWKIKDDDFNGTTAPLTFKKDQIAAKRLCYWSVQIKGGKFISPDNFKRNCAAPRAS
ncbi:hypothetical protein GCM10009547_01240 [Sporichthya brevicatena]|uniref:Leucine-binding protein domain-containing protein n=1 Tax=Sporichthya brevicatena TaxID=171442 RepID=A0ABP3R5H7_9ACTN